MKMDFDYLNYLTSTKLKKVNGKNVKPASHLIWEISFLLLLGCVVKITLDISIAISLTQIHFKPVSNTTLAKCASNCKTRKSMIKISLSKCYIFMHFRHKMKKKYPLKQLVYVYNTTFFP